MQLKQQPLLTAQKIQEKVEELGRAISGDYAGREVTLVAVLKGSVVFAADLMRGLTVPVTVDFIQARSYCQTQSQGTCELLLLPQQPIAGRHILVVEDIIDTGITAKAIMKYLEGQGPASVCLCSLLDKPDRRKTDMEARYTGFVIPDEFVVGYGMDYEERGRELPDIRVLTP